MTRITRTFHHLWQYLTQFFL